MEKPHIEKEYKMMIREEIYNQILSDLSLEPVLQTNYYYSTGHKTSALRIREKEGSYLFTLKTKGNGFRYEYEFPLKENSLKDERVDEVLKKFNITSPVYLGVMGTYRAVKEMKYGELCVDKSFYLGKTDYELEFELYDADNDHFEELEALLSHYGLTYKESQFTKFKRFLIVKGEQE